jgi:hypothetical protein
MSLDFGECNYYYYYTMINILMTSCSELVLSVLT